MRARLFAMVLIGGMVGVAAAGGLARAGPVASIADSGDAVELRRQVDGRTMVDRLPLYRSDGLRYFSAGVGLEERSAEYPPFPLKIVFTAGGKPFLSGVAVTIQPSKGGAAWSIPREQVEGPWLFVDVPAGVYNVMAEYGGQTQTLKGIKVEPARQQTLYLRWSHDRGIATALPAE